MALKPAKAKRKNHQPTINGALKSEEQYRRLFETAQDGILLLNADSGAITDANPFITHMLGYTLEDIIGKRLWEIGAFMDVKESKSAFEELQQKEYIRYEDLPLKTKSGQTREVEFVSNVYLVNGTKVIQCNIRDITDRKHAEEALSRSEEQYRRLFETAQDGILILDAESGAITDANPFITHLLGYTLEDIIGKRLWEIGAFADVKDSKAAFEELQRKEYIRYDDLPLRTKEGKRREVEFVSNVYLVNGTRIIQCNIRDITERKRAEEKLKKSEEEFRTITEHSADAIFITDGQGRYTYVNSKVENMLGYSNEELLSFTIADISPKSRTEEYFLIFQKVLHDGSFFGEIELVKKDGTIIPVDINSVVLPNGYIYGSCRDVTVRKQTERLIRESEKRFKALFDQAPIAIALIDLDGHTIISNKTLSTMVGYSNDELLRMKFIDFTYPPDARKDLEKFDDLIHGKISQYSMEKRFVHKNGSLVWVNLFVTILRDENGNHQEVIGMAEDISERKQAEIALQESNEKFLQLAENISDAFWIRSPDLGEVQYISPAYEKIWGRSVERLYAHPHEWADCILPEDRERVTASFATLTDNAPSIDIEYRITRPDGEIRWIHVRGFQVRNTADQLIRHIGIVTDITDRIHSNEEHERTFNQLTNLYNNLPEAVFSVDVVKNTMLQASPAHEIIFGHSPEEFFRDPDLWYKIIIPEDKLLIDRVFSVIPTDKIVKQQYRIVRPDGEMRWIATIIKPTLDDNGTLIRLDGIASDITERKVSEEKLKMSEEKFRGIFENVQDVYFELTMDEVLLEVSPSIELLSKGQYHREDLIGMSMHDFYYDTLERKDFLLKIMRQGSVTDLEVRLKNRDGSLVSCTVSAKILTDTKGNRHKIVGSMHDISEWKQAQDQLRKSEEQYRSLFDNSIDAILLTHPDGRVFSANPAACRLFEKTEEEICQSGRDGIVDKSDPRLAAALEVRNRTGKFTGELSLLRKDGKIFPGEISTSVYKDIAGNFITSMSIRDITERKEAAEKIALLAHTLESVVECVSITDMNDTILFVNNAFLNTYGYSEEEILGKNVAVIRSSDNSPEFVSGILAATLAGGWNGEIMNRKKNGEEFLASLSTSFVRDVDGNIIALVGIASDITERKKSEEKLKKSEEKYRGIFESVQDVYFECSIDGTILEMSPSCETASKGQYCRDDLIGKPMSYFINEADELEKLLAMLQQKGSVSDYEVKLKNRDGSLIPFSISARILFNAQNLPVKMAGSLRDISDRKKTENQITLLAHTLESISECVIVKDMNDTILFVNNAFNMTYGYSEEEILGKNINIVRSSKNPPEIGRAIHDAIFAGGWHGELIHQKKNGEEFPVSLATSNVHDTDGNIIAYVGVLTDITKRKREKAILQESEERYRRLVEYSPSAIMVHSYGKFVYVNPAAVKLLGAKDESELLGKSIVEIHHADHRESVLRRVTGDKNENKILPLMKEKFLRMDGETIDVEVVSLQIEYNGIPAMQDVVRDVTEQIKLQQQLLQTQKNESIGTLAGGIAHDFNNILGIILGYTYIIEHKKSNERALSDSVIAINQAVKRGASLVQQILTFARKTETIFTPIDSGELVNELVSMLKQTFPRIIEIKNQFPMDLPFIHADRTQLHQTILNLCVNARDAMPTGGVITITAKEVSGVAVKEKFFAADQQSYLCISVADTGEGMSETIRNRIFDPFFTTKPQGKGTGLGLSVVAGIVQAHHGFIKVESVPRKGTTFHLYFPVSNDKANTAVSHPGVHYSIGGHETILLVEDEELLLNAMTILLESNGYTVFSAHDGAEAVEIYKRHQSEISLVVTDLGLPIMTGLEEYKQLKEITPGINIIFASGFIDPDIKSELMIAGAQFFLQKPYVADEILRIIREALDKKKV